MREAKRQRICQEEYMARVLRALFVVADGDWSSFTISDGLCNLTSRNRIMLTYILSVDDRERLATII